MHRWQSHLRRRLSLRNYIVYQPVGFPSLFSRNNSKIQRQTPEHNLHKSHRQCVLLISSNPTCQRSRWPKRRTYAAGRRRKLSPILSLTQMKKHKRAKRKWRAGKLGTNIAMPLEIFKRFHGLILQLLARLSCQNYPAWVLVSFNIVTSWYWPEKDRLWNDWIRYKLFSSFKKRKGSVIWQSKRVYLCYSRHEIGPCQSLE